MHTLYLCYFGLREPLVQSQVLPYLRELARDGIKVSLLTFEPDRQRSWTPEAIAERRAGLLQEGIHWSSLSYHKRPALPATVYDILAGAFFAVRLALRERVDVWHGRALIAAAMGLIAKRLVGGRLIYDIRGFIAEEYVEAGRWKQGDLKYRLAKSVDRSILSAADGFVVLTERARSVLFPGCVETDETGRPIEVIPCCVDLERFAAAESISRAEARQSLGLEGRRVIVYLGALGGLYPVDEIAQFLATAYQDDPTTFALVLTQSPPMPLAQRLEELGLPEGASLLLRAPVEEVPRYLKMADIALSIKVAGESQASCSPTKIAEYLAAGLPVVTSADIGDTDAILEGDRVGVVFREKTVEAYRQALRDVEALRREDGLSSRCLATALERFHLGEVGGSRYRRLYRRLCETSSGQLPVLGVK